MHASLQIFGEFAIPFTHTIRINTKVGTRTTRRQVDDGEGQLCKEIVINFLPFLLIPLFVGMETG